jgi:hypothetical protein
MSDAADCHLEQQDMTTSPARRPGASGAIGRISALVAAFLAANFFTSAVMERNPSEWLGALIFGIVLAQFGPLAIWAALGTGRWHARLLWTTALALLGWFVFAVGFDAFTGAPSSVKQRTFSITAFVPLCLLAVQAPLWIARWFRGWRLSDSSAPITADDREARRFSMTDLLMMPLAVAFPLALARWQSKAFEGEITVLAVALVCLPILSGLASLPCTYTAFRSRTLSKGFLAIAVYSIGLSLGTNTVLLAVFGAPARAWALINVLLFICSILFATHGSLVILRGGGYILLPVKAKPGTDAIQ